MLHILTATGRVLHGAGVLPVRVGHAVHVAVGLRSRRLLSLSSALHVPCVAGGAHVSLHLHLCVLDPIVLLICVSMPFFYCIMLFEILLICLDKLNK